jgi:hypothetical protein
VAIVSATASFTGLTGALVDVLAERVEMEGLASPYPPEHAAANVAVVTSAHSARVVRESAVIAF